MPCQLLLPVFSIRINELTHFICVVRTFYPLVHNNNSNNNTNNNNAENIENWNNENSPCRFVIIRHTVLCLGFEIEIVNEKKRETKAPREKRRGERWIYAFICGCITQHWIKITPETILWKQSQSYNGQSHFNSLASSSMKSNETKKNVCKKKRKSSKCQKIRCRHFPHLRLLFGFDCIEFSHCLWTELYLTMWYDLLMDETWNSFESIENG